MTIRFVCCTDDKKKYYKIKEKIFHTQSTIMREKVRELKDEFFAEFDLLAALSTCPGGDLSVPLWGPDARDPIDVCRPLGIEVFKPSQDLLKGWSEPIRAEYAGQHGLKAEKWS